MYNTEFVNRRRGTSCQYFQANLTGLVSLREMDHFTGSHRTLRQVKGCPPVVLPDVDCIGLNPVLQAIPVFKNGNFVEFIGEFNLVTDPLVFNLYKKAFPKFKQIRNTLMNKRQ